MPVQTQFHRARYPLAMASAAAAVKSQERSGVEFEVSEAQKWWTNDTTAIVTGGEANLRLIAEPLAESPLTLLLPALPARVTSRDF